MGGALPESSGDEPVALSDVSADPAPASAGDGRLPSGMSTTGCKDPFVPREGAEGGG